MVLFAVPSQAQNSRSTLAAYFVRAEQITAVPMTLLAAIAARESSFYPWSINLDGQSYRPKNKKSALAWIHNSEASSFDMGLMQINSQWLNRFGMSIRDTLDPALNILLGSLILSDCISNYGIRGGLSCYHTGSPGSKRGLSYADDVIAKWSILEK